MMSPRTLLIRLTISWYVFLFVQPVLFRLFNSSDLIVYPVMMFVLVFPLVMFYFLKQSWKQLTRNQKILAVIAMIQPFVSFLSVLLVLPAGILISTADIQ